MKEEGRVCLAAIVTKLLRACSWQAFDD